MHRSDVSDEAALARGRVNQGDWIPVGLICGMAALSYLLNAWLGLSFDLPLWKLLPFPLTLLTGAALYLIFRRKEHRIVELALYCALWQIYPIFGTRLTFMGLAQGFPLQDNLYEGIDLALGFHWMGWWDYLASHNYLRIILDLAYRAIYWEPFFLILAAWIWAPGRNRELLLSVLVGLVLTIIIAPLIPAIGPAARYGLDPTLANVIANVRSAHPTPVWYMGVICFPSFHTVMAILYAWGSRGLPTFIPITVINLVVLVSVPVSGNHYFVDVLGGIAVSAMAIGLVSFFYRAQVFHAFSKTQSLTVNQVSQ